MIHQTGLKSLLIKIKKIQSHVFNFGFYNIYDQNSVRPYFIEL